MHKRALAQILTLLALSTGAAVVAGCKTQPCDPCKGKVEGAECFPDCDEKAPVNRCRKEGDSLVCGRR